MTILVTGVTGYIGSNLVPSLIAAGHQVIALTRKSSNLSKLPAQVKPLIFAGDIDLLTQELKSNRVDGIIHLASLFLKDHTAKDVLPLIESNVLLPTQLLEAASKSGVKWFINTGSFWQHFNNAQYSPVNLYAATKQAAVDLAQYYAQTSNTIFCSLELTDIYGPNDPRPKLLNLWRQCLTSSQQLDMSPGEQLIDLVHVNDVVSAYLRLVELLADSKIKSLDTFGVTSGEYLTLRQVATVFEKATGQKLPINWGAKPYRIREVMRPWNQAQTVPGWKPKFNLIEGIKHAFTK